jgi:hypothetical protein
VKAVLYQMVPKKADTVTMLDVLVAAGRRDIFRIHLQNKQHFEDVT